jgi:hypothetical protein
MSFGDQLRRVSSFVINEKKSKLEKIRQKLAREWVEANLSLINEAMLFAAENGNNFLKIEHAGYVINLEVKEYIGVEFEEFCIQNPYNANFESEIIRFLKLRLDSEGIKIKKIAETVRVKGKNIEFHSWYLQW